jgi:hypothetical protein
VIGSLEISVFVFRMASFSDCGFNLAALCYNGLVNLYVIGHILVLWNRC